MGNTTDMTKGATVARGTGEVERVVHGIRLLKPGAGTRLGFEPGYMCWGNLLDKTDFDTLPGMARSMSKLDVVRETPVFYTPLESDRPVRHDGYKAVVSKVSGKVYSIPSAKYNIVQDGEVAQPLFDVCQKMGLDPIGRHDGVGSGRTVGNVFFANPDYTIRLLEGHDEDVMLGVRWWNSYTGDMSYGAEVVGIRMVCTNYNMWGRLLGKWRLTHRIEPGKVLEQFGALVEASVRNSDVLRRTVADAIEVTVEPDTVPDLLWGIGIPIKGIDAIAADPTVWAPDVKALGLNGWTLYNASTAYITYRRGGGTHLQATEEMARRAIDLLTEAHDDIISRGKDRRAAYDRMLEKEREKAASRKVAAEAEVD